MRNSSDRNALAANVTISTQCKDFINPSICPFTKPAEVWFVEKGKLVDKFLAPPIAHRGKEGSDIRVRQNTPKVLDTIAALAHIKAVDRQDYRKQFNCLACAYIQANAIVQQLFNFCKVIALPLCRRELSVHPVNLSEG
jgi:hypothetical protein